MIFTITSSESEPSSPSSSKPESADSLDNLDKVLVRLLFFSTPNTDKFKPAKEICEKVGIMPERRVNELSDAEVIKIRETIDGDYTVEGDLRREIAMNIKRSLDLGVYRGLRHRRNLPVRGQRTHTNARTRKGPAKPIAGKKK